MSKFSTVCVLFGGVSTEHLISCISAANIIEGLRAAGHTVIPVGMTPEGDFLRYEADLETLRSGEWVESALAKAKYQSPEPKDLRSPKAFLTWHCGGIEPDVIFPAVHGINCEDGILQGFLEMTQLPYVGAGVLASAIGMDKSTAKVIFEAAGIPQVPFAMCRRKEIELDSVQVAKEVVAKLGLPLFLKPANGGSSVGTAQAVTEGALAKALLEVAKYDEKVLVEQFVNAREVEVAVLGNDKPQAAVPGEIVKDEDVAYYDYETKYFKQGANVAIPADVPQEIRTLASELAIKAYRAMDCSGLARVDFFLDKDSGALYLNEVNTLPGFTSISLYPQAWEKSGLDRQQLLTILCELAIERTELVSRKTEA